MILMAVLHPVSVAKMDIAAQTADQVTSRAIRLSGPDVSRVQMTDGNIKSCFLKQADRLFDLLYWFC